MVLGRSEETEVMRALYASASARPAMVGEEGDEDGGAGWLPFLLRLGRFAHAHNAGLMVEADGRTVAWQGEEALRDVLWGLFSADDPAGLRRMRADRVYGQSDLQGDLLGSRLALRGLRVGLEEGGSAWLVLLRSGEDFRAVDSAFLSSLGPHLPLAVDIWRRLTRERVGARLHETIAARLGAGWIAFDRAGRVIMHDRFAGESFRACPGVRMTLHARLMLEAPAAERALMAALEEMAEGTDPPPAGALELSRDPLVQLVLAPASDLPADTRGLLDVAAFGFLRGAPAGPAPAPALVARLFGLGLSEARLALALCGGASLAEAADDLGLTVETARSYSKKIYARTGTRGQADLMRLLLTSAAWLAPARRD